MYGLRRHSGEVGAGGRVEDRWAVRRAALVALLVLVTALAAQRSATALAADGLPPGVPVPAWAVGKDVHFDPAEPRNPRLAGNVNESATVDTGARPLQLPTPRLRPLQLPTPRLRPLQLPTPRLRPLQLSGESLKYEGGPVENEPRLVLIFLGEEWEDGDAPAVRHELEATAEGLPGSGYQQILTQYSSIDGPISPGPLIDSPVIEKYYLKQAIVGKVEIHALVNAVTEVRRLAGGPERVPDTTYAVLPAPGTAAVEANTCGYHVTLSGSEASLAAIMDTEGRVGCGPPSMTLTHEYAESVTDPTQEGWRRSDTGENEIADVCKSLGPQRMADGELVAALWDDSKNACEVEDNDPGSVPIGPLTERTYGEISHSGSTNDSLESETLETALYPCGLEAHYHFEYGTTKAYGNNTPEMVIPATWGEVEAHTTIAGLQYSTHYHWRLVVTTSNGTTNGGDHEFLIPYYVEVAGEEANQIEATSAHLRAEIQPGGVEAKYHFEYGPTEAYGSSTPEASAGSGTSTEIVGEPLTGLLPGTLYHFRIVASSSRGTVVGKDNEFSTSGGKPLLETWAAKQIGYTNASLTGTVEPKGVPTTFHFEYGTTTAYEYQTAEQPAATDEEEHVAVNDLTPDTIYHFRIVATNSYGTTYGADQTFSTGPEPLVETEAPETVGYTDATLAGAINPRGTATSYFFEYGTGQGYGEYTGLAAAGSGTSAEPELQAIDDLAEHTTYHFRIVATNSYGTVRGADRTFSTGTQPPPQTEPPTGVGPTGTTLVPGLGETPSPPPAPNKTPLPPAPLQTPPPPSVRNARQSTTRWRESGQLARISRAKTPTGTTFSFSLNEQATVTFRFTQLLRGTRVAHGCPAMIHKNVNGRTCIATTAGTLSFAGHSGTNNVTFAGRISRTNELKAGQYELTIIATNSSGQRSTPVSLGFTIVK